MRYFKSRWNPRSALGAMARFPPGCLDRSRTAIGRGLAPALNRSGSHDPNQVSPITVTRQCPGSSKRAWQGLDEASRECEDGTTDFAVDAPKRSIMESSSARNLDDLRGGYRGLRGARRALPGTGNSIKKSSGWSSSASCRAWDLIRRSAGSSRPRPQRCP